MKQPIFDRTKPYGEIRGMTGLVGYVQNGIEFDIQGNPKQPPVENPPVSAAAVSPPEPADAVSAPAPADDPGVKSADETVPGVGYVPPPSGEPKPATVMKPLAEVPFALLKATAVKELKAPANLSKAAYQKLLAEQGITELEVPADS